MGKGKKAGKRLNKKQMAALLEEFFRENPSKAYSFKEIFHKCHLDTHPLKMLAIDVLEEMTWDDFLSRASENSYKLNESGSVLEGTFITKFNGKCSFLPDGSDKPIFVAERNSMWALNGDRVKVSMMARRTKHIREAQVIEIIKRAKDQFVGRIKADREMAYLVPTDPTTVSIFIPKRKLKDAKDGDRAVVKVIEWPDAEHRSIVAADKISAEITPDEIARREDFREVFTCTIDPHDAKDFDDALSIQRLDNGQWEVGVHIADVSHYVTEGSVIDKEARERATSIYLVDRTIPMLPERLCNYICSLRPDEDKLAYSVIFNLDNEAKIKSYRIVHTVIRSNRRYAYEEVQEILNANLNPNPAVELPELPMADADEIEEKEAKGELKGENAYLLLTLDRLAKLLRAQRFKNGAVKFDREEMRFDIDETGKPIRCYFKRSKDANKLIEEFMLLANRTVAESVGRVAKGKVAKTLPYRVHDDPDPQKLETLKSFVAKFGYKMKSTGTKGATARALNQLMDSLEGKKESNVIQLIALRAMMKAKYSVHNIGHFGLAFEYYTHFTSPIRRYPDTMVHRLLTRYEQGGKSASKDKYEELCEHSSEMEQIAANAERDSIKYKMVEFMSQYIGCEFDAHISGITSYGIYCEINENHCEGMVRIEDLDDDYYEFDEKNYCLIGRRRHHTYQLGDELRIKVAKANLERKQLDFVLAEN